MGALKAIAGGITYTLVYSESVLLLRGTSSIIISLDILQKERILQFEFTNDGNQPDYQIKWRIDDAQSNKVYLTLNRWYSDNFVENVAPFELSVKDTNVRLALKCRITKQENAPGDFFKFEVSIFSFVR